MRGTVSFIHGQDDFLEKIAVEQRETGRNSYEEDALWKTPIMTVERSKPFKEGNLDDSVPRVNSRDTVTVI